jgi:hypothetical protein
MNIEKAKDSYIRECHKVGKVPLIVSSMTYDKISEQYTLSNSRDGEFADLSPDGSVLRMHWNGGPNE